MGNICRSPLLEGWAAHRRADSAVPYQVDSAGTGGWHAGLPPDPRAIEVARQAGIDISGQRARQVQFADFQRFDLVLCADRANLAELRMLAPGAARGRIALVLDWCGVKRNGELPDPYHGGPRDFERVCSLAREAADGLLRRLATQA
ncbi:phosphotyrosine protein phosphatase [Arenimonas caeni]|jgi:protein-tyrosine phosphatase|uniref:protein-tyrosine-phosphatase n=2 Tax=Arenimonas caeni TaxID=2058085 RepID=A0A2P6MBA8_9GAMM|nr:phosphotyrosine protein phosphatase [Arenimonas caeni]